jgi:Predicted membrane protein
MGTLGTVISWAVFGLVIGAIARFLYPGKQPMGWLATMALGIIGSFVGGLISWACGFRPEEGAFRGAGWIMSVIGALLVVWGGLYWSSRGGASGARRTT